MELNSRAGASLASDPELPKVIWLQGDEPFFEEFNLRAEDVMSRLGIRRSRLNQISGRELRVGKTRVNQYMRPVYRPRDVEEYLEWTRPTATHKRSSEELHEARTKLEEQSEEMMRRWATDLSTLREHFEGAMGHQLRRQVAHLQALHSAQTTDLEYAFSALRDDAAFQQMRHKAALAAIEGQIAAVSAQQKESATLIAGIPQLLSLMEYQQKALQETSRLMADTQRVASQTAEQVTALCAQIQALQQAVAEPQRCAESPSPGRRASAPRDVRMPRRRDAVFTTSRNYTQRRLGTDGSFRCGPGRRPNNNPAS